MDNMQENDTNVADNDAKCVDNGVKTIENDTISAEKAVGSADYNPDEWSSEPLRDPKTGRWVKGTGGSRKGGRPVGARDKITNQMIRLAEETAAEYGQEMFKKLAQTDPASCLALITRLLPNADLSAAIRAEEEDQEAIQQITINLVGKPTEQRLDAPQERLTAPVRRIEPSPDDLAMVVEQGADMPSDTAPETPPEPTQEELDARAAELERERIKRQNETLRQYGGRTGVPSRAERKGNGISYPDDGAI